jgi:imidazolonepropionase
MTPKKAVADLYFTGSSEIITSISGDDGKLVRYSNASLAVKDDKILALGPVDEVEAEVDISGAETINLDGKILAPGFVDCHTHLVFGKSRAKEFAMKMTQTTAAIEATGLATGIPASIAMTRAASEDELFASAMGRLNRMARYGTTTIESKSGYGINIEDELKMLRVNQRLNKESPVDLVSTFLGAHDFPPEIDRNNSNDRERYIAQLTTELIPEVASKKLAVFCDIYCDDGYYTVEESRRILEAGIAHGLPAKIHTDAYSGIGGSTLAAELPAISADHLNFTSRKEMAQLAERGVIGVVLPALDFAVNHPKPFVARDMIEAGMTLALGTNLNPGNWTESMRFVMLLACRNHAMSLEEAFIASTLGSAMAIGRENEIGSLEPGKKADLQIWDILEFEQLIYRMDYNPVVSVFKNGNVIF